MPPGDVITAALCGSATMLCVADATAVPATSGVTTSAMPTPATSISGTVATRSGTSAAAKSGMNVGSTTTSGALDAVGVARAVGTAAHGVKKPARELVADGVENVAGAELAFRRREGMPAKVGAGAMRAWRSFLWGDCVVDIVVGTGVCVRVHLRMRTLAESEGRPRRAYLVRWEE